MNETTRTKRRRLPGVLRGYAPLPDAADELMQPDGRLRSVWLPLIEHLARQDKDARAQRFARGDQYLHDAGVYYRQYTGAGSTVRDWPLSHVPVLISEAEWRELSYGIAQRADLLEAVMADLYGPGRLVADGHLPAQLVAQNPEWLRPLVGVRPREGHFLHFLAFEIGRSPDGTWFVLGDRTQAPSGAGFAIENRMATARVFHDLFPDANIERLAGFFRSFRRSLEAMRPGGEDRIAILTPGQHTDTYFEHAYIARYLGFMLLEAEDLTVVDGRLMVRTINGLEPIGVLWRRLDSRFGDPLELDEDSAIGTPGMVSALRSGTFSMLNWLGSGVLEARALMAFLPRISEALTGEPLRLPNIATWWCGQAAERDYVLASLERMMIGPALSTRLPFDMDASTVLGGQFRSTAYSSVKDWLSLEGTTLVGQEAVSLSTTPAMINGRLEPRPMVVRVFAARTSEGWTVMPGGYARIGRTEDPTALAMQNGGSVADVWVVADAPVEQVSLAAGSDGPFVRRMPGRLPARSADNLFWLGRYVERAEFGARALRAYHLRREDMGAVTVPVIDELADFLDKRGLDPAAAVPEGLLDLFEQSRACAGKVRDRFSTDGWNAVDDLAETARGLAAVTVAGDDAARAMSVLLRKLAGFAGLVQDNMFRFAGWRFLTMGRALERGATIAGMLAEFSDPEAPHGSLDLAIELGDSVMTHRRRYSVGTNRLTAIDLLALDTENPRALSFQTNLLREQQALIPGREWTTQMEDVARRIYAIHARLAVAIPEDVSSAFLREVQAELLAISDALTTRYLS